MLEKIIDAKKKRLAAEKARLPLDVLKNRVSLSPRPRNFRQSLAGQELKIIAEIKKASPSLGDINPDLDVEKTAVEYEQAGASAISVLTEEDYFKGAPEHLKIAKENTTIPILRKDFILDNYQVYQSRYLGADAVLLIASILKEELLGELVELAIKLNIEPLVEVHSKDDLTKALKTKAKVIGVNNRDLNTFETDLKVSQELVPLVGKDKLIVSESGIKSREDVILLQSLGVDAILVGESIVKSGKFKEKIEELKTSF